MLPLVNLVTCVKPVPDRASFQMFVAWLRDSRNARALLSGVNWTERCATLDLI